MAEPFGKKGNHDLESLYQETKESNPRREQTKSLYLDIDAETELEGRIQARQIIPKKTLPITSNSSSSLSEKALEYEKKQAFLK